MDISSGRMIRASIGVIIAAWALPNSANEPAPRTSLDNAQITFTIPVKPYVVLRRGELEIVVVDNRAVEDDVLPKHRAGYAGLGAIRHRQQPRSLFVPTFAGLNLEHIIDGSKQSDEVLFEPRKVPMQLRKVNDHVAELWQAATPHYGVESCHRFEMLDDGTIEMTFECVAHRKTWVHDYLMFFWASYIDQPESLDIHFVGSKQGDSGETDWIRGTTPRHGVAAVHRASDDLRHFPHVQPFPLELPFAFSNHRYAESWYAGKCRGMLFAHVFRKLDQIRFAQSPSGGGLGCPAWDFQWIIDNCQVGQRYQLVMRIAYQPQPDGVSDQVALETLRQQVSRLTIPHSAN
jgi:hypothetical protein